MSQFLLVEGISSVDNSQQMKNLLALVFLVLAGTAYAGLGVGIGNTSATSGRLNPALQVLWEGAGHSLSVSTVGFRNDFYFESAYSLAWYKSWLMGALWSRPVMGSVGVGGVYSVRGYRESTAASLEESTDTALGPGFRVVWWPAPAFYLGVEGIYGLRGNQFLTLNFQDYVLLSVGVHL